MTRKLATLTPAAVWEYFEEICQVPRPSKREGKIIAYLLDFATKHRLESHRDAAGNVLIRKPASKGSEDAPAVVLQAHVDMVCEKNGDSPHDFDRDPIQPCIDGEWVKALGGTTLGADDGIGMAACMAVLTSTTIRHGPLECLFTVDEESGLTGALALQPGLLRGKMLLNLDSEDEGELFIGCAGGIDTVIHLECRRVPLPPATYAARVTVKNLLGGHSGDDINKGRGNAIKILNRLLWNLNETHGIRVALFEGGKLRNAIPREATAVITLDERHKEHVVADFNLYAAEMKTVWEITEQALTLTLDTADLPATTLDDRSTATLLNALHACPHGVFAMSHRMPGLVETSTNLASIKFEQENRILVTTSQRSDIHSEKMNIAATVASLFRLAGARVEHGDGYPGWTPDPDSSLLRVAVQSYEQLFGQRPVVRSVHAGLECGLFSEKYPGMEMISFGPTLRGVHSPGEMINIETVARWWRHLVDILERLSLYNKVPA
jgi:dipeptidase D